MNLNTIILITETFNKNRRTHTLHLTRCQDNEVLNLMSNPESSHHISQSIEENEATHVTL